MGTHHYTRRMWATATATATAFAFAGACGGAASASEAADRTTGSSTISTVATPSTTVPPTTVPPTTVGAGGGSDGSDDLPVEVASEDGFVTLRLPDGWQPDNIDVANSTFDTAEWSGENALDELLAASNSDDTARLLVARDKAFLSNPGLGEMNRAFLSTLGVSPNIELTTSPLGEPGHVGSAGADGTRFELHTAHIDGQFLAVLGAAPADDPLFDQLEGILDSVVVDVSVIGPLAHAVETELAYNPDGVAPDEFLASLLVPADWFPSPDDQFTHRSTDGSWLSHFGNAVDDGDASLESLVAAELETSGAEWLDEAPVVESRDFNGVPYVIAWEGPPSTAIAAIVMGFDGVIFHNVYVAVDDPLLLGAIVESVWVSESAIG